MTLDKIVLHTKGADAHALYVGASRVREIEDLFVVDDGNLNEDQLKFDIKVLKWENMLALTNLPEE